MDAFLNLIPAWFRLIIILFWANILFLNYYLFLKKENTEECLWTIYEAGDDERYPS